MSLDTRNATTSLLTLLAALTITTAAARGDDPAPAPRRTSTEPQVASRSRTNTITGATRVRPTRDEAPAASEADASSEAPGIASEPPQKQWVWLEKQGLWGYGYQIAAGPHKGLWRIDPESKQPPADAEPPADPYRFTETLNRIRASVGLGPVAYDHDLSAWAAQNNAAQCNRGLGHHVNPNCYQNCAWNTPEADSTVSTWLNSPGHRDNMLAPDITRVGIAFGPGPYWTMNAR